MVRAPRSDAKVLKYEANTVVGGFGSDGGTLGQVLGILPWTGGGKLVTVILFPQRRRGSTTTLVRGGKFHDVETLIMIGAWEELGCGCLHVGKGGAQRKRSHDIERKTSYRSRSESKSNPDGSQWILYVTDEDPSPIRIGTQRFQVIYLSLVAILWQVSGLCRFVHHGGVIKGILVRVLPTRSHKERRPILRHRRTKTWPATLTVEIGTIMRESRL
jgi:hypothetical protein